MRSDTNATAGVGGAVGVSELGGNSTIVTHSFSVDNAKGKFNNRSNDWTNKTIILKLSSKSKPRGYAIVMFN